MKKNFLIPYAEQDGEDVLPIEPQSPWLAPMAGYSDLPFRALCHEYGARACVTEMISAKGLLYQSPGTADLLQSASVDRPLVVQLFGSEPETMGEAVRILRRYGYRFFDCNMGCPARKVMRQGAGAALLDDIEKSVAVARSMILAAREFVSDAPRARIGFKLRLGVAPGKNIIPDLPLMLEAEGADWICLHPRYASQGYTGSADWEQLANISPRLGIPLLASGDLFTAEDGIECINCTGANGVMYARGALRNPAIFTRHRLLLSGQPVPDFSAGELRRIIMRHIELAFDYGKNKRAFYKMRSLLPRYARGLSGLNEFRKALCLCADWPELLSTLDNFLPSGEVCDAC